MRWVCVCEGGNVRSAGLAYRLKDIHKQDAIAVSWRWNTTETLRLLFEWSDYVVFMQPEFVDRIDSTLMTFQDKFRVVDVGLDRFRNPFHPDLQALLAETTQGWEVREFKI